MSVHLAAATAAISTLLAGGMHVRDGSYGNLFADQILLEVLLLGEHWF